MRRPRADSGVATVLVLSLCLVLMLVAGLLVSLAAVSVARQRAAAVADLAALAVAGRVVQGQQMACARARQLAADSGATLLDCRLVGSVAEVVAQVRPAGPLGRLGASSARARAGPVG